MTLGEAIRDARQWTQEDQSTPGGGSPFFWQSLVVQATDALCRDTDCLALTVTRTAPDIHDAPYVPPADCRIPNGGRIRPYGVASVESIILFRVPGEAWEVDASGNALPLHGDSVCPVPTWAQAAIPLKAAHLRCIQFPTTENTARAPGLAAEYQRIKGDVAARSQKEFRALVDALRNPRLL